MKPILRIAALTSAIVLTSPALLPGQAGDASAPPASSPEPAPTVRLPDPRPGEMRVLPTLRLENSKLGDVLNLLRDLDGEFQFILLPADAADRVLPPMKLRDVTAADVLRVLSGVDLGGFMLTHDPIELAGTTVYRVQVHRVAQASPDGGGDSQPEPPLAQTEVFVLPAEVDPDKLLPVIDELAAAVAQEGERPGLRFHPEGGILIVRGTESQIEPFRRLVSRLHGRDGLMRRPQRMQQQRSMQDIAEELPDVVRPQPQAPEGRPDAAEPNAKP